MSAMQALRRLGGRWRRARVLGRLHATPAKASYLVALGGERFVLRVDEQDAAWIGLDRAAEYRILQAAAAAGVAPEPVGFCALGGVATGVAPTGVGRGNGGVATGVAPTGDAGAVLVTRFAPGRAWRARDLQGNARLAAVAELLRRVHAIRVPGVPRLDLEETLRSYAALAGGAVARRAARQGIALARAAGLGEGEPVLCHHDPIAANLVGFRRMVLIDWEYSACGDPLLDLAVVIRHHRLAPRRAVAFARAYFGDAAVPWERLALACRTYDVLLSLWLRAMQGAGRITARQQQQLKPLALPGIM